MALSINKPSKYMQMSRAEILQTDLNTFPLLRVIGELDKNLHVSIFPFMTIFITLTTFSLYVALTLLGENRCWSLMTLRV